jgi:hypothetical protein
MRLDVVRDRVDVERAMTATTADFLPLANVATHGFIPLSAVALFEYAREVPLDAMTRVGRAADGRLTLVCEPRRVDKSRQMATMRP